MTEQGWRLIAEGFIAALVQQGVTEHHDTPGRAIATLSAKLQARAVFDARKEIATAHAALTAAGIQDEGGDEEGNEFALRLDERIKLLADSVVKQNLTTGDHATECARLRKEAAKSERRAIAFGDIVNQQVLVMRAALVEAVRSGPDAAMNWIRNTLAGPGHLPSNDDVALGAQALYDKEIAEAEAFRAAHPAPKANTERVQDGATVKECLTVGQKMKNQYYLGRESCKAKKGTDPHCICWHDEGTGPFPLLSVGESITSATIAWRVTAADEHLAVEPVAWQFRSRLDDSSPFEAWENCTRELAAEIASTGRYFTRSAESRAIYAHPAVMHFTGWEILRAAKFVIPDWINDRPEPTDEWDDNTGQLGTPVTIQVNPPDCPPGTYIWCSEYPDEGAQRIDDEPSESDTAIDAAMGENP